MNIYQRIHAYVQQHKLITPDSTIIIGLSGGPDSVFLLHYLVHARTTYNLHLIAAHLDHGWRDNSAQDERFCRTLCAEHKVTYVSKKLADVDPRAVQATPCEALGRTVRRIFFERLATEHRAAHIALAHHDDDQQETFFIRLMRGTSLTGLCSMRPRSGIYIRPLLALTKQEIVTFLQAHNLTYVVDESNTSDRYLRNRLRNHIMPHLHTIDSRWRHNFGKTMHHLQETERFLEQLTDTTYRQLIRVQVDGSHQLDLASLRALDKVMQYRLLIHWLSAQKVTFPVSQSFLDELLRFIMHPDGGTHTITQTWTIMKKKGMLSARTHLLSKAN